MAWLLSVVLLSILVLAAVLSPWRWPDVGRVRGGDSELEHAVTALQDLESARDAKYREIRDAELDRETGKLSPEDFATVDAGLRAEAVEILQRLDRGQARLARRQRTAGAEESVDTSWTHSAHVGSTGQAAQTVTGSEPVQGDRD